MPRRLIVSLLVLLALLAACSTPTPPPPPSATPAATSEPTASAAPVGQFPPATIANDEGGPTVVLGEWNYTNYAVASHFLEPVVALMDVSSAILANYREWAPRSGQILGRLLAPITSPPVGYQIDLPILPGAANVDVDNDGESDPGVLVYALALSTNLTGDSYLEQLEQGGYSSVLADPQTGAIREGDLLVWAPDEAQGFPAAAGADGRFFTSDDPVVGLPAGYTLATFGSDGKVSFERAQIAHMYVREPVAVASPDFSDRGILESYNALLDLLKVRYAYSELRKLEWEQIRQTYLPQVQAAEAAGDMAAYYAALFDLAQSIRDAHVQVTATDPQIRLANLERLVGERTGGLGAAVAELSDGRVIATYLDPNGPAAQAGWVFGTVIVSVNGVPINEHIAGLPLLSAESTDEGVRLAQLAFALALPPGEAVTVEYLLPGEQVVRSVTMTASEEAISSPSSGPAREEISFRKLDGDYGYIQWTAFDDPLYKLAVWEKFLSKFKDAPGLVIDLRDNGGGNLGLMYTLASYLFPAETPVPEHWLDNDVYDEAVNGLVREFAADYMLSAPKPELAYRGPVVVLVNEGSASAAEYLPQFLQRQNRAQVIGEHGTDGAGGVIERVAMPGGIIFQFTKGRTVFAGTDEYNLEGKGVTLDVRVPITVESEQARLEGRDPLIEAALATLAQLRAQQVTAQLTTAPWQWQVRYGTDGSQTPVGNPANYTLSFVADGSLSVQADCNQASGTYTLGDNGALTITLGPVTAAACDSASQSEVFLTLLSAAVRYQIDSERLVIELNPERGAAALLFGSGE